jgi:hypothetical protein
MQHIPQHNTVKTTKQATGICFGIAIRLLKLTSFLYIPLRRELFSVGNILLFP